MFGLDNIKIRLVGIQFFLAIKVDLIAKLEFNLNVFEYQTNWTPIQLLMFDCFVLFCLGLLD